MARVILTLVFLFSAPLLSPQFVRGRLRVGAFNPYHHCWRFAAYTVVVFASLFALGLVARKSRLEAAKSITGRALFLSALLTSPVFKKLSLYPYLISPSVPLAFPALNSQKQWAKFSPAPENFAQEYLFNARIT